jgi:polyhydroxyalkanoate synthesis regulator phasin
MIDLIRKSLLAGVGAAVVTKDKIEDAFDEFVKDGKLNATDAKIIANKIAEQGRKEFEETVSVLFAKLRDTSTQADTATHTKIATLQERIRELEKQLSHPPTRSGEP